jgi:regulator of sigma E protease
LPIPILDGGHLLFFTIEGILRKPLGERQREIAQQVGLFLLVGIMVFALWNDIERLISR